VRNETEIRQALEQCLAVQEKEETRTSLDEPVNCPFNRFGWSCCPQECSRSEILRWVLGEPSMIDFVPPDMVGVYDERKL
jgi:hypothetical protein